MGPCGRALPRRRVTTDELPYKVRLTAWMALMPSPNRAMDSRWRSSIRIAASTGDVHEKILAGNNRLQPTGLSLSENRHVGCFETHRSRPRHAGILLTKWTNWLGDRENQLVLRRGSVFALGNHEFEHVIPAAEAR